MLASDTRMNIHATEEESAEQVFKLIDHQSNGAISCLCRRFIRLICDIYSC